MSFITDGQPQVEGALTLADSHKLYELIITHTPLFREGVWIMLMDRPSAIQVLVMNIHNPFMHCTTSQYVFKPRDIIMLMRAVTIVAA